jgi:hypothetical protein
MGTPPSGASLHTACHLPQHRDLGYPATSLTKHEHQRKAEKTEVNVNFITTKIYMAEGNLCIFFKQALEKMLNFKIA